MLAKLIRSFVVISLLVSAPGFVVAGNIYDSNILQRIKFTSSQRSKVSAVLRRSDKEMSAVFRKYGINPNAKPEFEKLRQAGGELKAVQSRQKREMKQIMSAEQYQRYLEILEQTAARVIKATRKKP